MTEAQVVASAGLLPALYLRLLAMSARLVALLGLVTFLLVLPANLAGGAAGRQLMHVMCWLPVVAGAVPSSRMVEHSLLAAQVTGCRW